jgi:hypothetical protein
MNGTAPSSRMAAGWSLSASQVEEMAALFLRFDLDFQRLLRFHYNRAKMTPGSSRG